MARADLIDPALEDLVAKINTDHRYWRVGLKCQCQGDEEITGWEHRIEPQDHFAHLLTVALRELSTAYPKGTQQ